MLHGSSLDDDYAAAWKEWSESDADAWEATAGDGWIRSPDADASG